jgi:hypothetical protein
VYLVIEFSESCEKIDPTGSEKKGRTVLHPESETRRGEKNRGHSAVIMEMTDEQEKPI